MQDLTLFSVAVSELARYFGKEIEKNKEMKKMVERVNKETP